MKHMINEQLQIELMSLEHASELFLVIEANRTYFNRWLIWPDMPENVEQTRAFLAGKIERFESGLGPHFVIRFKGVVCGIVGFHEMDPVEKHGSIGYWLDAQYSGQGLATMSATKLIEIGFADYQLKYIEIKCMQANVNSQAVAKRLGFTLVDGGPQSIEFQGKILDVVVYRLYADQ